MLLLQYLYGVAVASLASSSNTIQKYALFHIIVQKWHSHETLPQLTRDTTQIANTRTRYNCGVSVPFIMSALSGRASKVAAGSPLCHFIQQPLVLTSLSLNQSPQSFGAAIKLTDHIDARKAEYYLMLATRQILDPSHSSTPPHSIVSIFSAYLTIGRPVSSSAMAPSAPFASLLYK